MCRGRTHPCDGEAVVGHVQAVMLSRWEEAGHVGTKPGEAAGGLVEWTESSPEKHALAPSVGAVVEKEATHAGVRVRRLVPGVFA